MTEQLTLLPDAIQTTARFKVSGNVEGVLRTVSTDDFQTTAVESLELTFEGIPGDRHAGFTRRSGGREPWYPRGTEMCNERQVSILSVEELVLVAERMGIAKLMPEWIGGNILLSAVPNLTRLPARTRLVFDGGAVIRIDGENIPCRFSGEAIGSHNPEREGLDLLFPKVARGLRGVVGYIEKPGVIRPGETVTAHVPEQWIYPRTKS
ncbi:molybdenum cofactor sulfurase [uncultured Roseibium sp.]|uniref:MOSC domain-containing protein n=1 Tax=uncultured Roseibium sp. TaxID=1936171 RepID=UPI00263151D7|nr:molybdenum cofactor sulfurase [uncultured Roseibium sp.]